MDINSSTELEKLVKMAEEVSETVSGLHTKIANLRIMFMFSTIGLYAAIGSSFLITNPPSWISPSPLFYGSLIFLATFLGLGSSFYIYKYFKNIRIYKRNLDIEIQIMHRLLSMVHEYKENIHVDASSYVERAILDMRLQRIEYSSKW